MLVADIGLCACACGVVCPQMITIDVGQTASSHVADLMGEMSLEPPPEVGGGGTEEDDLLDLLDGAE